MCHNFSLAFRLFRLQKNKNCLIIDKVRETSKPTNKQKKIAYNWETSKVRVLNWIKKMGSFIVVFSSNNKTKS